jgi:acyl carrier protein
MFELLTQGEPAAEASGAFSETARQKDILQGLRDAPPRERRDLLMNYVRGVAAGLLGFSSAQQIEPRQRFFDLGIDSLASVELKNRLELTLRCPLPATFIFDHPTLDALVDHLHEKMPALRQDAEAPSVATAA